MNNITHLLLSLKSLYKSVILSYKCLLSNNLNKTMKLLTSVTVILTIPTMVFSFYGMNVGLPLGGHPLAFLFILAGTVIVSFGLLAAFNKKDLLFSL